MSDAPIEVPGSLELLDVAGNGMACEKFLWIRGLSDRTLAPKARIDLIDDIARYPGELLHLASRDGSCAATTFAVGDAAGAGSVYITIFCRTDPGEPILGDLVAFSEGRARAAGLPDVRSGGPATAPHIAALQERHGFEVHDRWRRFRLELAAAPAEALPPTDTDDDSGLRTVSLAARPDLLDAAFAVYRDGLADTPGDFPRPDETAESWAADHDSSPVLGREMVFLLLDPDDEVLAFVELERLAMGSRRATVEFLAVARPHRGRGLARTAKQHAAVAARDDLGLTSLETLNHATNTAICRLNASLGWTEDVERLTLRRVLA